MSTTQPTAQAELKPCPFCGAIPIPFDGDYKIPHKPDCAIGMVVWLVGERRNQNWNRRAGIPDPGAAIKAAREAQWMPIETAPKDGTRIDVWHEGEFSGRWTDVYWGKPYHECGGAGDYCDSDWHSEQPNWTCGSFNEFLHFSPTHWMPIPACPCIAQLPAETKEDK